MMNDREMFESVANAMFAAENEWKKPTLYIFVVYQADYNEDGVIEECDNLAAFFKKEDAMAFVRHEAFIRGVEKLDWREDDEGSMMELDILGNVGCGMTCFVIEQMRVK